MNNNKLFSIGEKLRDKRYKSLLLLFVLTVTAFVVSRPLFETSPGQKGTVGSINTDSHPKVTSNPEVTVAKTDPPHADPAARDSVLPEPPRHHVDPGSTGQNERPAVAKTPKSRESSDRGLLFDWRKPSRSNDPPISDPVNLAFSKIGDDWKLDSFERKRQKAAPGLEFRRLTLRDEYGKVPVDGLQKAKRQTDRMRDSHDARARAAGKDPKKVEMAGLDPSDWQWLGPGNIGGRVRAIDINPSNPLNILAGSVSGGIWLTTNAGESWQAVDDFMANLAVSTIVRNPKTPTLLYAGTGEGYGFGDDLSGGGVFQSTDSGATWTLLASANPAAPAPPVGMCGVGLPPCPAFWQYVNRLAISPDGGTMLAATGISTRTSALRPVSTRPGNLGGIARSIDGGQNWTQITNVVAQDVDFDPNNSLNAIAAELTDCGPTAPAPACPIPGSVRRSTDGGQTWNAPITFNPAIVNANPSTNGRTELAYAVSNSTIIYALVNQNLGDVYQSTDSGLTFNRVYPNAGSPTPLNLLSGIGWYADALWVNPVDPTFLLVGGRDLFQSGDSGTTFAVKGNNLSNSAVHVDHHIFVANPTFDDTNDKSVYFGNDGGVYRVDDIRNFSITDGWTNLNNNLGITQFYGGAVTATGVVFGGTQDNGTIRVLPTPNLDPPYDPQSWVEFAGGDGGFVAADPLDAGFLYGSRQNMEIFRSSDGGATANDIYCNPVPPGRGACVAPATGITDTQSANFIAPLILDPSDPNTMLAGGLNLWRSNDVKNTDPTVNNGLPTWAVAKNPNPTIPPPGPAPTPTPAANPISAIAVSPTNSNFIVVGHNDGQIFLTVNGTNGTPTWNQINIFGIVTLPNRYVTRLAIDDTRSPNWIYATFGGFSNDNVYVTRDLGANWIDVSGATGTATDLPAVPIRSIVINPANNNFLYVGTEVGIFASEDAGATWQIPQDGPANVSVDELFLDPQGNLMAATHGRGIYTTRAPVLDLPACAWNGDPGPPCPSPTSRCKISEFESTCCFPGDWSCPCSWNSKQIPTVNDDVYVYCPMTVNTNATARNLRVDGRLSMKSGGVSVVGDIANFGLIESVEPFSSNITANNLLNVRPENAVTLKGIISLNLPSTIRGSIANYGIIMGAGFDLNGPPGSIQTISGNGEWNSSFLNINRTAVLTSDVTLAVGSVTVNPFARLRLNDRTMTVNGNAFFSSGTVDVGSGTFIFGGNDLTIGNPNNGDTEFGVKGTGTFRFSPTDGNANFMMSGGTPGAFEPHLRFQSGTVDTVFRGQMDRTLTVDPGAVVNLNEGPTTVNGDITVNGTIAKSTALTPSDLNFNGATFTNNGSVMIDFIQFSTTGGPRNQSIAGAGLWPAATSLSIGAGARSTTTLMTDVTLNHDQLGVSSFPAGSVLNLGNFTLTYGGNTLSTPHGGIIGTGRIRMAPLDGTSALNTSGTDPIASGVTIASGSVTPSARVSGAFTVDPGATLSGGGLHYMGNTFTNNGSIVNTNLSFDSVNFTPIAQQLGGTGTYGGTGQIFFTPRSTTTLLNDLTYIGSRIYNEGRVNTGAFTLTLPCPTGSEGPGDIIGNVRRTNLAACPGPMAFGSPFTTIRFTSGTPPTEITVNTLLSAPAGFAGAAQRTYFITPTGGGPYTATLRLHYLDSELNGNNETSLQLWRNNGTNWTVAGATNRNTVDNWVEYDNVTTFSPWALSQLAPTAAGVSVSGRVLTRFGKGVTRASVTLTDSFGRVRSTTTTNTFGYFRFVAVEVGRTYVVSVGHKTYRFPTQVVNVTDEISGMDITAEN